MDNSQLCKLFIGGLNVQTTEAGLREHFEGFGELTDCVVVVNPQTKRSRCFGFVTYSAAEEADAAMAASPHVVDGSSVELKRAVSREDSVKPGAHAKVKKLFIGGLREEISEDDVLEHFQQFGDVEKVEIIADKMTGRKRGFGFVHFQNHDGADKAAVVKFHPINGHRVEVKKAVPKEEAGSAGGRPPRGGAGGGSRGRGGRGGGGGGMRDINGLSGGGGGKSFSYGGGYGSGGGGYGSGGGYGGGSSSYGSGGGGYGGGSYSSGGYGDQSGGYGNGFGSYSQQHQSSYGPVKSLSSLGGGGGGGGAYGRSSATGPYRGGYASGGGGGGGYGGSSYGGGASSYGGGY